MIIPIGLKDKFNRTSPADDAENFGAAALAPEPARLLNALFNLGVKETNRTDIVQALLTGVPGLTQIGSKPVPADTLKVNLGVPPSATPEPLRRAGEDMAGFPNGRRLADDVVDIELRVIAGALLKPEQGGKQIPLGDGVDVERQAVPLRRSRTSRCPTRRSTRSSSASSPPTPRCPSRRREPRVTDPPGARPGDPVPDLDL